MSVWVRENFSDKWHSAESQTTKRAVCGYDTAGSNVWEDGNRHWYGDGWLLSSMEWTALPSFPEP